MNRREIKFRARDIKTGEWFTFGIFEDGPGSLDLSTVGQFTGLKDKNGKEIYEGDVLEFKPMFGGGKKKRAFIDWFTRDADYWLYFTLDRTSFTGITNLFHGNDLMAVVIGNIYENPELLPGKQAA